MKSNHGSSVFERRFVKDLPKYVQFSEEEQKKLDEMEV